MVATPNLLFTNFYFLVRHPVTISVVIHVFIVFVLIIFIFFTFFQFICHYIVKITLLFQFQTKLELVVT